VKVLVLGSGGREHALAWRLAKSPSVKKVFAAPGNPGIAQVADCVQLPGAAPADFLAAAREYGADLTVVGPEAPLVTGVVDAFRAAGMPIVGPTAQQAQLEGSKVYAKNFFAQFRIPTAEFVTAQSIEGAKQALDQFRFPLVVKTDGLAAGKGVIVANDRVQAEQAIEKLGPKLVLEEFLEGEEVSFIALCDGRNIVALEPCQDHKAVFDNDQGPNTGGMGAYCDSRILSPEAREQILDQIIRPTVAATGFTGFLYAGLMMTASGPKLLEFNVRLGDPETQPIMHRMEADLGHALWAAARGELSQVRLEWRDNPSLCSVLASEGYPGAPRIGQPISGVEEAERTGAAVFHAGTRLGPNGLESAGGRVLGVTHSGPTLAAAMQHAYAAVEKIHFGGMHFRSDIGRQGLRRYNESSPDVRKWARSSDG
jgi:phosphoribosylamine--glycine ligase